MTWFTFALLAGACFAGSRVASRLALRHNGNPLAFTAITDFLAGLILLPFVITKFSFPSSLSWWATFSGIILFAFFADWLAFASLRRIPVSEYQLLNQSRHVFILIGGLMFFSEAVTGPKVVGIALITIGVALAVFEKRQFTLNRGTVLALVSTLAAVVAFLFAKATVSGASPVAIASLELMLIGFLSLVFLRGSIHRITAEFHRARFRLLVSGLAFGGFEGLLFLALKSGEGSRVIPVTQISLPITVVIGIFFLGEKDRLTPKIIGTALAVLGILALYFV